MYAFRRLLGLLATALAVTGVATASAQAAELHVKGERTAILANNGSAQFFATFGITVTTTGNASTGTDGSLILPVTHGLVNTETMDGRVFHSGGVKFTHGDKSLWFRDFVLVRERDNSFLTAKLGDRTVVFAQVTQFKATPTGNEAIVTGELKLSAAAAHAFNELLGSNVAVAGTEVAKLTSTLSFTA